MSSIWGNLPKYGEYEIVGARENKPRLLGEGSFGKTYEAIRTDRVAGKEIRKHVAVKVLNPVVLTSETKRLQFIQEIEALTEFQHSNLIHYIRCGEEEGEVYYAMDLCRGGDLVGLVRRYGALSEKVAALIGLQVATGLRELHYRHRLVHRDIKPSNIMIVDELEAELTRKDLVFRFEQQDSLCRVVDFGLVNLALNIQESPQRFVGSPMYASPEQITERPVDGRSDIYSLGMTLWYLVQGKGPLIDHDGRELRNMSEAMQRHMGAEEYEADFPLHLSTEFRHLLGRMTAKRPGQRYADAADLQKALRQYLESGIQETELTFSVTRLSEPLDTVFELGEKLPSRSAQASYAARERSGGRQVKLSVAANLRGPAGPQEVTALVESLSRRAELSRAPSRPEALVPVREVLWATDLLAYTEDMFPHIALADVLKARSRAKRAVSFAEVMPLLGSIAEALDFLLQHGQETVVLPCEEVWLTGPAVALLALNPRDLTRPLDEWNGLQVRFSTMYVPPAAPDDLAGVEAASGATMAGSMQISGDDLHPVRAFARLIYRILNGSEVPAAVSVAPAAYIPAVTLGHASNGLIRDLVCRKTASRTASGVLKELCLSEGIVFRALPGSSLGRTGSYDAGLISRAPSGSSQAPSLGSSMQGEGTPAPRGPASSVDGDSDLAATITAADEIRRPREKLPTPEPPPGPAPSRPVRETPSAPAAAKTAPVVLAPKRSSRWGLWVALLCGLAAVAAGGWFWQQQIAAKAKARADAAALAQAALAKANEKAALSASSFPKAAGKKRKALLSAVSATPAESSDSAPPAATDTYGAFAGQKPGARKVIGGIPYRWCPPTGPEGFLMGSPADEPGRSPDETSHRVVLTQGFWFAETELTQGQWTKVMGTDLRAQAAKALADDAAYLTRGKKQILRDYFGLGKTDPVEKLVRAEGPELPMYWVNWDDAEQFCLRATAARGAGAPPDGWKVALPTEAQWEEACRAGTTTAVYAGEMVIKGKYNAPMLDGIAWYGGNSGVGFGTALGWPLGFLQEKEYDFNFAAPRMVARKTPNRWGLSDLIGNVDEWCADRYGAYPSETVTDPQGPAAGDFRVFRGGGWRSDAAESRAAFRLTSEPGFRQYSLGFRPAIVPIPPEHAAKPAPLSNASAGATPPAASSAAPYPEVYQRPPVYMPYHPNVGNNAAVGRPPPQPPPVVARPGAGGNYRSR